MGREIRRVPPNWEHPKYTSDDTPYENRVGEYRPLFDEAYEHAAQEWIKNFDLWRRGKHKSQPCSYSKYYWEYDGPPDEEACRPAFIQKPTWYQVYETVSEGTPVTPPFETPQELVDYLSTCGDFWDQTRRNGPWSRANAEQFVKAGFAMTAVIIQGGPNAGFYEPRDGIPESTSETQE